MSDVEMDHDGSSMDPASYDPDQDPEEKRAVRKDYRNLAKGIEENHNDYTAENLTDQVKHADRLFDRVKGPQEATLDSAFLLKASNLGAQKAKALKSGSGTFDIDDFVSKLLREMGGRNEGPAYEESDADGDEDMDDSQPLSWFRVGRKALSKSRRVPAMGFMLGPLLIEQKTRAPVKRSKLEKNAEDLRRPQEIREEDIARAENETTKNVQTMATILEAAGPTNLFELVINPNDYAQSVENVFQLSFLIRDGKVALEFDDNATPIVYACSEPDDSDYAQGLKKRQFVLELDMAAWKQATEVFDIKKPMVPQRPPAKTKLGDKWYG